MFVLSISGYLILSAIVLTLFALSIVSSFATGHWFVSIMKLIITFFLVNELINGWKKSIGTKGMKAKTTGIGKEDLLTFLSVIAGSIVTYALNHDLALGAVTASAAVGLAGVLLLRKYQVPLYCGSFAGMVGSGIIAGYPGILVVGVFTGALYVISKDVFNGFGGKLGAMAFFGTTVSSVVLGTISKTMVSSEISIDFLLILYFMVGAAVTFLLRDKLRFGSVLASASVGLLGAIILPLVYGPAGNSLAIGLFCGSFVGMSSVERLYGLKYVILASMLGAVIFLYTQPYFNGLGGKLGAIAFGSGIATAGFYDILKRFIKNPGRGSSK